MKADEYVILLIFRINLAICIACFAATMAGCVNKILTPAEAAPWFAFGVADAALLLFLPGAERRSIRLTKKVFTVGVPALLLIGHSYFYPNASLLDEVCCAAALFAGLTLLFCIFRKKFALPTVRKIHRAQALRAQGVPVGASHFRD